MDNLRRGLHSHAGAGAKTSLAVSLTELKHKNYFCLNWYILGAVYKKLCRPLLELSMIRLISKPWACIFISDH
jgi:hypothetical protein